MIALLRFRKGLAAAAACALIASPATALAAATIVINNTNAPGVGFNDPAPAVPVGGNTGTTLGQQRLIAFAHAANLWGATLTSNVPIVIDATFEPLTCNATGAVLGSAGATVVFRDFTGAPFAGTWYSYALANKLFGAEVNSAPSAQIRARFNVNLGQTGCLTGTFFYLGLDNSHGSSIDFVTVLLHEMSHGLGFQTFTNGSSGNFLSGFPSAWDHFLRDNSLGLTWVNMTAAQRQASAIAVNQLVWSGAGVTNAAPGVLSGVALLQVSGTQGAQGTYAVGTASFGPPLNPTGVTADIMPIVDQTNGTGLACTALDPNNALAVNGKIALIDRGTCGFTVKVKNAQNAGAVGVIIGNNVASSSPPGLGGTDPTITIPAVGITQADGNAIKVALQTRSRTRSGVIGFLGTDQTRLSGTDAQNRLLMFTPNPFQSGSSVSHYDTTPTPNQLMEPAISGDLSHSVVPPVDLTFPLLQDTGW